MTPGVFNYENHVLGDTILRKRFRIDTGLVEAKVMAVFSNGIERIVPKITIADETRGIFFIEEFKTNFEGKYIYDIHFTFPCHFVRTYIKGELNILPNKPN